MSQFQKYELAFAISPVPLLLVAADGSIVMTNAGLDSLFEYDTGALLGQSIDMLVPPNNRSHHPRLRDAYFRVPSKRNMGAGRELCGITRTGTIIPLELGLQPMQDGEDQFALVAVIDIRQRKNQEERMQMAMDAAASAMVMVQEGGTIVFANRAASTLFGYAEDEMLGQPITLLVPNEVRKAHPVYVSSFFSIGQSRQMGKSSDLFARHKDGHTIPVQIALTTVASSQGSLVMSTIIDLTERVAAAEALARKNEELAELNVELSHFANSASHDLKAPLSSITGLLGICLDDLDENNLDEVRANLKKVRRISERSARKVEGILAVARAGRESLPVEAIAIEPLVDEIWLDLTGQERASSLTKAIPARATITSELPTLRVILENLLSNAIRYSDPAKPKHIVAIRIALNSGKVHITVEDNGVGIPKSNQDKVFHLFKRLDDRSGDGLGLALTQKQVERLGGTISFSSCEGNGATFEVILPQEGPHDDRD